MMTIGAHIAPKSFWNQGCCSQQAESKGTHMHTHSLSM